MKSQVLTEKNILKAVLYYFQALKSLVLHWNIKDDFVVEAGIAQMCELSEWKVSSRHLTMTANSSDTFSAASSGHLMPLAYW